MLHKKAVGPRLLELIDFLMKQPELNRFVLVGGTALALQIGHRVSVDADLFGIQPLEDLDLAGILAGFGPVTELKRSKSIQVFSVDSIKVDIVNYRYPLLRPIHSVSQIRMASLEDIGAMKLNAIAGRGSRKDFIDLYFLLQQFKLTEIIDFYSRKYTDGSAFMVIKSLHYFEDAEKEEMPQMLQPVLWETIKDSIANEVQKL
jgi:hypothetical protein